MPSPAPTHATLSSPPRTSRNVPADDNSDNNHDDYNQQIIKTFGYNPNDINSIIDFVDKNIDRNEIIDWYSDQENYSKLQVVSPAHGHKKIDLHNKLVATLGRLGIKWGTRQIKDKLYHIDMAFRKAAGLWRVGLTGRNNKSAKAEQLLVCPYFDKLSRVLSTSAAENPPPFRVSGRRGQDIIQDDDVHVVGEDDEEVIENHFAVVEDELEENIGGRA
ncbi:hypothetical protein KI688_007972 [Linnemannia hyalina]|uniref:Uncharacterized protein n=1 Tax=Linnemannia hyalina TaxID=64524 RepID=A0A9P8BWP9_9FUNG|nr:hypothetical protein KI688_007972 [Linnemannia hyalina]